MTERITGASGAQPQPQQPPKLDDAEKARLKGLGISEEAINAGPAAVAKEAQTKGIDIRPQQPKPGAVPVGQRTAGAPKPADGTVVERTQAQEGDELRRENEKYRQQQDQEFIQKSKAYANAVQDYQDLEKEVKAMREEFNAAHKKKVSLTKKQKEEKAAARELAAKNLEEAEKGLAAARQRMLDAKAALGDDQALRTANRYNREQAVASDDASGFQNRARVDSQRAARTEVDDYYNSNTGRQAVEEQTRKFARGDADHKLTRSERADRAEQIQDEFGVSKRYAKRMVKRAEKNLAQMQKEDALQKIIIGDKDAYKAQRKDDENGNPTVTYMSKDTYEAARKIAASKGLQLPEDAKELTGDMMKQFQQIMMDAAGDFGSRGDLNERRGLAKEFHGVSSGDVKRLFKATNVDYQKDYTTAAVAAGAAATAATAFATGGLTDVVGAVAEQVIPGAGGMEWVPGTGISGADTGHYELKDLIIPGSDGHKKFDWGKAGLSAASGILVEELIRRIGNNDPNLLKKGKSLEDAVYKELSGIEAFKKHAPNARKVLAKVLTDPNMNEEQKLALMAKAMGNGGPKLSPRELVAMYIGVKSFQQGDKVPENEVKPVLEEIEKWDINEGDLDGIQDASIIGADGKISDKKGVEAQQADGLAYDQQVVGKDKRNKAKTFQDAQLRDSNGRLINQNDKTHRSQYVVADEKGETKVELGQGTPQAPDKLQFTDNTNGPDHKNVYEYRKLSAEEAKAKGLPEDGTYYELISAKDPNGKDITQTKGKVFKLNFSTTDRTAYRTEEDQEGYTTKREKITIKTPHYEMEAADHLSQSSSQYVPGTGAQPSGVSQTGGQQPVKKSENKPGADGARNSIRNPQDKGKGSWRVGDDGKFYDPSGKEISEEEFRKNNPGFPLKPKAPEAPKSPWQTDKPTETQTGRQKIRLNLQPGQSFDIVNGKPVNLGNLSSEQRLDRAVKSKLTFMQQQIYDNYSGYDNKVNYLKSIGIDIETVY